MNMINSTNVKSTLAIKYLAGQDKNGKDVFKTQRFQNVKPSASDSDVFDVATALGNLLENPDVEVIRENDNLIVNE
ncbi:hypothetical protein CPAL_16000 [Clostridium thermopalmarium DSM 5974]|uniref:DUF1659 domain-containing protein n=2 Tax=Clostridium TaxID=1485 RepID=A0A2T0ARG3_9CLOT|nr:hypothetical protein CPAL_16000 [Clostridium thermopalmarium DSM 5974]PVZ23765.1 uncharacterized protein DUF1659 [Clostridium thermopalmarium DSM 5974]